MARRGHRGCSHCCMRSPGMHATGLTPRARRESAWRSFTTRFAPAHRAPRLSLPSLAEAGGRRIR
jgi:hypothetical protein